MEKLDMKKSSREAWSLLKRLEGKISNKNTQVPVKAQAIAAMLVANSKGIIEKEQIKTVKKELKKTLANSTSHHIFDTRFSAADISTAIGDIKKGKAPGRDGVHPEFLHNLSTRVAHNCVL